MAKKLEGLDLVIMWIFSYYHDIFASINSFLIRVFTRFNLTNSSKKTNKKFIDLIKMKDLCPD